MSNKRQYEKTQSGLDQVDADSLNVQGPASITGPLTVTSLTASAGITGGALTITGAGFINNALINSLGTDTFSSTNATFYNTVNILDDTTPGIVNASQATISGAASIGGPLTVPSFINPLGSFAYATANWTPVISNNNANPNTVSYNTRIASYVKIGRLIHYHAFINFNFTITGIFEFNISGFPFAPAQRTSCSAYSVNLNGNAPISPIYLNFDGNQTICSIRKADNAYVGANAAGSNQQLIIDISFLTA